METKMQLQRNANVIAAYGQPVGYLDRVVLDPKTRVITDIVIQTGTLFKREDRVVPIAFVADTDEGEILLREEADELDAFPPFEEQQIVEAEEDEAKVSSDESVQPMAFGSPTFGMPLQATVGGKIPTRVNQNIPEGSIAMKEGAKVMSADGKNVGLVERVFTRTSRQQMTHMLISPGGMFNTTMKLVPMFWVKDMKEEQVDLKVEKNAVDALADISSSEREIVK